MRSTPLIARSVASTRAFWFPTAYVPTLAHVRDTVQDANTHLLGLWREGDGVSAATACHRDALMALRRFLVSMKVH